MGVEAVIWSFAPFCCHNVGVHDENVYLAATLPFVMGIFFSFEMNHQSNGTILRIVWYVLYMFGVQYREREPSSRSVNTERRTFSQVLKQQFQRVNEKKHLHVHVTHKTMSMMLWTCHI